MYLSYDFAELKRHNMILNMKIILNNLHKTVLSKLKDFWFQRRIIAAVVYPRLDACPPSLTNRCETQYFDGKKKM